MTAVATRTPTKETSVTVYMAEKFGMDHHAFEATLRATVIKPDKHGRAPTREEFAAFLLVCKQYDLNPLTKEIFAFTDKGALVPIVSVDGWAKLINSHPQCDGITFDDQMTDKGELVSITCNIFRKDRKHPVSVTEYMAECKRGTDTWRQWPRRMLRHKALIQCARYAFGFAGIYDEDEGERIVGNMRDVTPPAHSIEPPVPPEPSAAEPPIPPEPETEKPPPTRSADTADMVAKLLKDFEDRVTLATTEGEIDDAFNELVFPNMEVMSADEYQHALAVEDKRRGEIQNGGQ